MPKSPPPTSRGGSRRAAPTKVAKPFPWGTVLGSAVLVLVLGGVLAFAALNPGSGRNRLVTEPDKAIEGLSVVAGTPARDHVAGPVDYDQSPPNSGAHNATPQQCAVYDAPIAPERALHSLEHGAVWVTYTKAVAPDQLAELAGKVEGDPYRLMSPVEDQAKPVVLSAWGRTLAVDSAGDDRVDDFLTAYTNGPQSPERGAACAGSSETGPLPAAPAPAPSAPAPSAPAASVPSVPAPSVPASPAPR